MTTQVLHFALVFHIIGIAMMAGTTIVDTIIWRSFWKQYAVDRERAVPVLKITENYSRLFGIGGALLILSGIAMVIAYQGIIEEQLWFRIKMGVLLLIILNVLIVGRPQIKKIRQLLSGGSGDSSPQRAAHTRKRLQTFHVVQLVLFTIIFILSVFRFS